MADSKIAATLDKLHEKGVFTREEVGEIEHNYKDAETRSYPDPSDDDEGDD